MNPKLKQLIDTFQAKSKERDELLSKGEAITQEDVEKAKTINGELVGIKAQVEDLQKLEADSKADADWLNKPNLNLPLGTNTVQGGASVLGVTPGGETRVTPKGDSLLIESDGTGFLSEKQFRAIREPSYKQAFRHYCRAKGELGEMPASELKVLQEGRDEDGGFLVPDEFMARLIEKAPAPTRVAGRVTILPVSRDTLVMPRVVYATDDIYSTGIRAKLTGEVPASATTHRVTEPVFGETRITIGTWMLSMPLTNDLVEDSAFPILGWASRKFGETRDLLFDDQIENGSGIGANPHGILKNPGGTDEPAVVLSATANDIDADQLVKTPFKVPEQYINPNTAWIMNRADCGAAVALLKDSQNRYLFQQGGVFAGMTERTPDTLNGYPIVYSAFMPNRGDGKFPIIFGDPAGYYLAQRAAFSVRVLNELLAETNQLLMLGRLRFGGVVAEPFRMVIGKSDNA